MKIDTRIKTLLFYSKQIFPSFKDESKNPASIYLFQVNNRKTIQRCEICSKITVKTPERRQ